MLQSYWENTLTSATFKEFENIKGIPKPWVKLRNVTTFDAYGFHVRDRRAERARDSGDFKSIL